MKCLYFDDLVIGNFSCCGFFKGVGVIGVLLVVVNWGWCDVLVVEKKVFGVDVMFYGWVDNLKIYVSIDWDGMVGIVCNCLEMGQGVCISLVMVVVDELEVDWSWVKVIQVFGDEVCYGNQDIDGLCSMCYWFEFMCCCGVVV